MGIKNKDYRLNEILSMINMTSLLFSIIALIRCMFGYEENYFKGSINFILITTAFFLIIFYGVHAIFINKKGICNRQSKVLTDQILLIIIFSIIVIISGAHKSEYKELFLFVIISATIKGGMKAGLNASLISSIFILGVDLVLGQIGQISSVNIAFESDIILSGVFIFSAWTLGYYVDIENKHIHELERLINRDGLTDLYNHRYFYDKLRASLKISKMTKTNLSLMFLDIDDFKYYNDLNGHQKGDYAIKNLANILKASVRQSDIIARYGGEEFAIIMQNTNEREALILGEKVRKAVENTKFYGGENQPKGKVTISIGISEFPTKARSEIELVKSADDALYRAKFLHKNRVETYVSILDDIRDKVDAQDKEVITSIKTLISVINAKDKYTYGHVERVVMYSRLIAEKLSLNDDERETLIYGAYIHDIGKINIPKEILIKKMPLDSKEWLELKEHPTSGFDMIKNVDALKHVAPLILHHHERYDGLGYPCKLKGKEIPFLARILTVIDSFDAMTSNRPYNRCKSYEEGKEELLRCSNTQFDPDIVKVFIEVIDTNLIKKTS